MNIPYTFPVDPPFVPKDYNPVGCYRRQFVVPADWAGRQHFLRFEGVKSAYYVWLNGVEVGFSKDSMCPAEFDITSHVKVGGVNLLAVQVYRWSDGSYLEDQDAWDFSGIYRDVHIYATPAVHITNIKVDAGLDTDLQHGTLSIDTVVSNHTASSQPGLFVNFSVFDVRPRLECCSVSLLKKVFPSRGSLAL